MRRVTSRVDRSELIAALSQPQAYPFQVVAPIDVCQTHISMLFFVDDRVFKVKKAVDMGFLDYTTIERRQHFCAEEVRLNRRLAGEIYRGVTPIMRDASGKVRVGGDEDGGEVIDYAVEMVRLDERRMLANLIEHNDVDQALIDTILDVVIPFHEACERGGDIAAYGDPAEVMAQMRENLERLEPHATRGPLSVRDPHTLSRHQWSHLRSWVIGWAEDHHDLLRSRAHDGFVRELHGDMHAGNICLTDDGVVIYDCIEYTRRYRCRDVACEMAYLAMDLDSRGRPDLATHLIERYATRSGDRDLRRLDAFYRVNMAIVRCLVESIRSREPEVDAAERDASRRAARQYASLAVGYTCPAPIIVMCGLPGTGKSWCASALARAFRAAWVRSDVVRKEIAGVSVETRDAPIYTVAMTRATYTRLLERARAHATQQTAVILDATYATKADRDAVESLARELNVPSVLVYLNVGDASVIKARLAARASDPSEPSDAGWRAFEEIRSTFEPPTHWAADRFVQIDATSDEDPAEVVRRVQACLTSPETSTSP